MPTKTAGVEPAARASAWRSGSAKIDVGVLGATGAVGQQFIALLANHPWFRVTWLAATERSAGKRYGDLTWRLPTELPEETARLSVEALKAGAGPQLVFSALDSSIAGEAEIEFAQAGHIVVSNSRNHRMDALVPSADSGSESGAFGIAAAAAEDQRVERRDRDESELRGDAFGDRAGSFADLSTEARADHDAAGIVGRRISGRGVARCDGERDSIH